jgi:hypothetical protein
MMLQNPLLFFKQLSAGLAVLLIGSLTIWLFAKPEIPDPTLPGDIPVVIRTNGGLLEVASVRHRRSFDLAKDMTFLGFPMPFCRETARYAVDAVITYRVKLATRWAGEIENGRLLLTVPPPRPAIPVAFDTSRLTDALDACRFAPSMNTKSDLLKSISGKLAADAIGPRYVALARDPARKTVQEFAQKWLLSQSHYRNLNRGIPIDVSFTDE